MQAKPSQRAPADCLPGPLRVLLESSRRSYAVIGLGGEVLAWNATAERAFGWREAELSGRPLPLVTRELQAELREVVQAFARGERVPSRELPACRKDGTPLVVRHAWAPLRDDRRRVFAIVILLEEVTASPHAEWVLPRAEESFRTLVERSADAVFVHRGGRFVYLNPAAVAYLGYERTDELIGRDALEVVHPDDRERVRHGAREAMGAGKVHPVIEQRLLRRDGQVVFAETQAANVRFEGAPSVLAIARDLTERKRLDARVLLQDRMAAVGTLAAGVAHEINNPLTYVISNLGVGSQRLRELQLECGDSDVARRLGSVSRLLDDALQGADRVRNIVGDLKTFSRKDDVARSAVEVQACLERAIGLVHNEVRHRARLVRDHHGPAWAMANESRLVQVFVNLLVNAVQALEDDASRANVIRTGVRVEASSVVVEVSDTGAGIATEQIGRVFEPFFTTKPVGVGTGLGLFLCQNIVRSFDGTIAVTSDVGRGTTFRIVLPQVSVRPTASEVPRPSAPPPPAGRRKARILIVDDEHQIGMAIRMALDDHEVATCTDGRQALELVTSGTRFDLVMCDLMMPIMTGMDFYEALVARAPDQAERTVFLTGGAFTPRARSFLETLRRPCLEKPFELSVLRTFVEQHVGRGAPGS